MANNAAKLAPLTRGQFITRASLASNRAKLAPLQGAEFHTS